MSTLIASRRPVKPGSVKVLRPVGTVNDRAGEVQVNGKPYLLEVLSTGYRLFAYDGRRQTSTCYDLPTDLSACDCPDATYRAKPEGCKHRRALAALRGAGKLPACPPEGGDYKPGIPF
jgi:hypothetical protein